MRERNHLGISTVDSFDSTESEVAGIFSFGSSPNKVRYLMSYMASIGRATNTGTTPGTFLMVCRLANFSQRQ
jgi:hypothetical protein